MVRHLITPLILLVLAAGYGAAGVHPQGIRGRASLAGTLVEGVTVAAYAYRPGTFGPLTGEEPAGQAIVATDDQDARTWSGDARRCVCRPILVVSEPHDSCFRDSVRGRLRGESQLLNGGFL